MIDNFRSGVAADAALLEGLRSLCGNFTGVGNATPTTSRPRETHSSEKLRSKLSHTCVSALQPDLIIMDEFQRFNELLHGDHDAAILAQELFNYSDQQGNSARTLLLSATPYRMLTLSSDNQEEGDHYRDFLETLSFLFGRDRGKDIARDYLSRWASSGKPCSICPTERPKPSPAGLYRDPASPGHRPHRARRQHDRSGLDGSGTAHAGFG